MVWHGRIWKLANWQFQNLPPSGVQISIPHVVASPAQHHDNGIAPQVATNELRVAHHNRHQKAMKGNCHTKKIEWKIKDQMNRQIDLKSSEVPGWLTPLHFWSHKDVAIPYRNVHLRSTSSLSPQVHGLKSSSLAHVAFRSNFLHWCPSKQRPDMWPLAPRSPKQQLHLSGFFAAKEPSLRVRVFFCNVCTHDFLKTYVHVQLPNLGFVSGQEAVSAHLKDIKEFKFAHTQRGGCSRFGIIARGVVDNENLRCQENGYILSNRRFAESLNSQRRNWRKKPSARIYTSTYVNFPLAILHQHRTSLRPVWF